jgi:hypothetical protein
MRWWLLLVAKLALLLALHLGLILFINRFFPQDRMGKDLDYTFWLLAAGMFVFLAGYAAWIDQRYRCRSCCSRLRMPLAEGNWSRAVLFAPPKLEWICPHGHGAMRQEEFKIGGGKPDVWTENEKDFWKAFEDAWRKN